MIVVETGYLDPTDIEVTFRVSTEASIPTLLRLRAESHVSMLNLNRLYEIHSKTELIDRKRFFDVTFRGGGPRALQEELTREYDSRIASSPNSWQTALYEHLKDDDVFLNGGFNNIPEG